MTIPADYREFFVASAGATGALVGLLFVAVSVFPELARDASTRVEYHARSSAALVVFTNALLLSLVALVPDVDLGWWCVGAGLEVLAFAVAMARSVVAAARRQHGHWNLLTLVTVLLLVAGFEFSAGVHLIADHGDIGSIRTIQYVIIGDIALGIARAWQLVNMHDTGLFSSLRIIAHGDRSVTAEPEPTPDTTPPA